jgi:hypothetical protein
MGSLVVVPRKRKCSFALVLLLYLLHHEPLLLPTLAILHLSPKWLPALEARCAEKAKSIPGMETRKPGSQFTANVTKAWKSLREVVNIIRAPQLKVEEFLSTLLHYLVFPRFLLKTFD